MKPARVALLATVAGALLVWTTRVPAGFTLPKLMILALGVAAAAACLALSREPLSPQADLGAAFAAAFVALSLATAFSNDPALSFVGRYDTWSHGVWAFSLYACLLWLCATALKGQEESALTTLAVLGVILSLDALAQRGGIEPWIKKEALPQGRAVATLGSPVDLAAALVLLLGPALWLAARRLEGCLAVGLIAAGLWSTGSRGAWLGALCGVLAFLACDGAPAVTQRLSASVRRAIAAMSLLALIGALSFTLRPVKDAARFELWRAAGRAFLSSPFVGTGPDTFEQTFRKMRDIRYVKAMRKTTALQAYAHNDLMQALASTGFLGLSAYIGFLWVLWRRGRRALSSPNSRALAAGLIGGLTALFINIKFNPVSLEVLTTASVLAGTLCALGSAQSEEKKRSWPIWLVLAIGLASVVGSGRLWAAERHMQRAKQAGTGGALEEALSEHRQAEALTPCEVNYGISFVNDLGPALNATRDVNARIALLNEASAIGRRLVQCHPHDPNAHFTYGFAENYSVQLGLLDHLVLVERQFDEALALDPMFEPLLQNRLQVALKHGDAPTVALLQARLAELAKYTGGK